MSTINDDDLTAVLKRAYPQGAALLHHEGGTGILRLGAREVLDNPLVARDTLRPRELRALGRALLAVGQQHVAVAERMLQLAEDKAREPSTPEKDCSGRYNTEAGQ